MDHSQIRQIAAEQGIDLQRLPDHIGIIMDGNGRWAKARRMPRVMGHRAGALNAKEIFKAASALGIRALTLYTFSEENWQRPPREIGALMRIFKEQIEKSSREIITRNLRFFVIGDISSFHPELQKKLEQLIKATEHNTGTALTLALGYGGRSEIASACKALARDVKAGVIDPEAIDVDLLGRRMQTSFLPNLDLIIRTSGERRISNFLLWQCAYAELYFTEQYWPEFYAQDLLHAIKDYQSRDRRFGRISAVESDFNVLAVESSLSKTDGSLCSSREF